MKLQYLNPALELVLIAVAGFAVNVVLLWDWELEVGLHALMEKATVTDVTEFNFPGFKLKRVVE